MSVAMPSLANRGDRSSPLSCSVATTPSGSATQGLRQHRHSQVNGGGDDLIGLTGEPEGAAVPLPPGGDGHDHGAGRTTFARLGAADAGHPDRHVGREQPGHAVGHLLCAPFGHYRSRRDPEEVDLHGVGPVVAARVLADVGDVTRFADRNRFASWTGTAPLDASSGEQNRHRLSRAGNRRMNHMIHIAAISQIRLDTEGRAYYRRKRAEGKKPLEAIRCLKRRISDAIYRQLLADSQPDAGQDAGTGPGGHCGATLQSSAVDLPPHIDTSDQPLPGPANQTLQPASPHRKTTNDRALAPTS